MTPVEEIRKYAKVARDWNPKDLATGGCLEYLFMHLRSVAERLETEYVLVPKDVVEAAAGIVAGFADDGVRKYGEDSPAVALRHLAVALGWRDGKP